MTLDDLLAASDLPVLAVFKAAWCGPCRAMAPVIQQMADEWADDLAVVVVDIEDDPDAPFEWSVKAVPTLILISEDGSELARLMGVQSKPDIEAMLYGHFEDIEDEDD